MPERIDVIRALEGTPRHHYLIGEAEYSKNGAIHVLSAKVLFPADEEHPTVFDRGPGRYMDFAHVNVMDCFCALWNAAHIMGNRAGYERRILRGQLGGEIGRDLIRPNVELDLLTTVEEIRTVERNGTTYNQGRITGGFSLEGVPLLTLWGEYHAEKKLSTQSL